MRYDRRKSKAKGLTIEEVKTKEAFIYNGLIKCHHCKTSYSSEKKRKNANEWVYLRPTKPKDNCPHCKNTSEEIINEQVAEILKRISIPQATLELLNSELKDKINVRSDRRQKDIERLQKELDEEKEQKKENLRRLMSKDPAYSITITIYNNLEQILDEDIDSINLNSRH